MVEVIQNDALHVYNKVNCKSLENKKILITGSTGMIGLHTVAFLKEAKKHFKFSITCIINSEIDKNVHELFDDCFIVKGNLTEKKTLDYLREICSNDFSGYDIIFHAAGYGQPQKFMSNKIATIKLNTEVIVNLFSLLNKGGKFLYCSTSEIYSGLDSENITESMIGCTTPDHPRSCYIESKRCGEAICNIYADYGYDVKVARISLAYGPGTKRDDARVLNNFIQKAFETGKIELLDSGSSLRTYGYISDITKMLWNILLHGCERTYNVSGKSKITICDLAHVVAEKLSVKVVLPENDNNSLSGNPKMVGLNLNKYCEEFNDYDFIDLNTGIENTIKWQKEIYAK